MQTVIISRFLLNLRRIAKLRLAPSRASGIRSSLLRIPTLAGIVEDMGRPLDYDHGAGVEGDAFGDPGEVSSEHSIEVTLARGDAPPYSEA